MPRGRRPPRLAALLCTLAATTAAADDERWTAGVELIPLALVTLDVHVERCVHPQVGVALLAGVGYTTSVVVGSHTHGFDDDAGDRIRWTSYRAGAALNLYQRPFSGALFGIEIAHYGYAARELDNLRVFDAGGYFGWKWLEGPFTAIAQAGAKYFHSNVPGRADNVTAHGNFAVGLSW